MSSLKYSVFKEIIWSKWGHECGPRCSMANVIIEQMCTLTIKQHAWWRRKPWPGSDSTRRQHSICQHTVRSCWMKRPGTESTQPSGKTALMTPWFWTLLEDEYHHLGYPLDSTVTVARQKQEPHPCPNCERPAESIGTCPESLGKEPLCRKGSLLTTEKE